ncbi:Hypothetical protein GbCGDNIH1_5089 [Granulibacter bethesdensis CGDNIH1]|uniref:Uncharacterized protein n=1 Tax=Granulibacter bethesdensis (strain ATCC BAA-1260 / CGDNIH1) TaxID=391165 RepID=A0A286M303_GRABC|nr:Hypothetical protein GbCGDNIH5_5089 [Granulibacter bethesdensis]APH64481.1 Hypothetical protein GbCGDNIH1I4_5089 [Granulibacter bethesdensis]ASV62402.1 Hypothetical protein GbCGDNIH1_5089 [Granulibacter bethesdensis CGDNIH1]
MKRPEEDENRFRASVLGMSLICTGSRLHESRIKTGSPAKDHPLVIHSSAGIRQMETDYGAG